MFPSATGNTFFVCIQLKVLYKDNHVIVVSKSAREILQGDKTGDLPLSETVKTYIKETCGKPGNVFLGVVHQLDRPVSGGGLVRTHE